MIKDDDSNIIAVDDNKETREVFKLDDDELEEVSSLFIQDQLLIGKEIALKRLNEEQNWPALL